MDTKSPGHPDIEVSQTEAINREKYLSHPPVWVETDQIKAPKVKEQTLLKAAHNRETL